MPVNLYIEGSLAKTNLFVIRGFFQQPFQAAFQSPAVGRHVDLGSLILKSIKISF
jgi:hypothetical protein